jgi:hypothetical protein
MKRAVFSCVIQNTAGTLKVALFAVGAHIRKLRREQHQAKIYPPSARLRSQAICAVERDLKLPKDAIKIASVKYECSTKTVQRVWALTKAALEEGSPIPTFDSKRKDHCGRKKLWKTVSAKIVSVPTTF